MARLMYSAIASLDGYVADENGDFSWCAPDEEVHAFVNDLLRPAGTYLYGRRTYEVMTAWETLDVDAASPAMRDFTGLWRAADKVVHSRILAAVTTARTRLERELDLGRVRALADAADRDVCVGGPTLAAPLIRAGLVDDLHLLLAPVLVGGGLSALPGGVRLGLDLVGERRFASGFVHLHHRSR